MHISQIYRRLGVALASVALIGGAAEVLPNSAESRDAAGLIFAVMTLVIIFLWYRADSTALGFQRKPILSTMILAAAIFAVPYYLFRSRGFVGGIKATGVFVLVAAAYVLLVRAGAYLGLAVNAI